MKKVSIIVPVKNINEYIKEAIIKHQQLSYENFELLIFPDVIEDKDIDDLKLKKHKNEYILNSNIRIIASGNIGPAEKRNLAFEYAKGDIYAFIDDDAYPEKDWLKNAIKELENSEVGAVGGPAVAAKEDDILKIASGKIYESFIASGKYTYRYTPKEKREVNDFPSVNLIVKKEVFEKVNGYNSYYYPGEDTKLCLDITNLGYKIVYSPDVIVYHHRRSLFVDHLKQIKNYAIHRGYFAKKFEKTSLKIEYFIPTLYVIGLFFGPLVCILIPKLWIIYFSVILLYLLLVICSLKACKTFKLFVLSLIGVFLTNICYGIYFVKGIFTRELTQ